MLETLAIAEALAGERARADCSRPPLLTAARRQAFRVGGRRRGEASAETWRLSGVSSSRRPMRRSITAPRPERRSSCLEPSARRARSLPIVTVAPSASGTRDRLALEPRTAATAATSRRSLRPRRRPPTLKARARRAVSKRRTRAVRSRAFFPAKPSAMASVSSISPRAAVKRPASSRTSRRAACNRTSRPARARCAAGPCQDGGMAWAIRSSTVRSSSTVTCAWYGLSSRSRVVTSSCEAVSRSAAMRPGRAIGLVGVPRLEVGHARGQGPPALEHAVSAAGGGSDDR